MSNFANLQKRVLNGAKGWWEARRPVGFSLVDHIRNPTINMATTPDHKLARAIAALEKEGWRTDESFGLVRDLLAIVKEIEANRRSAVPLAVAQQRHEVYRRAEAFLGKREITEESLPNANKRGKLVRSAPRGEQVQEGG